MQFVNKRALQSGQKIRVLVVDDSALIRRIITNALSEDPQIEIAGAASNGVNALQRIPIVDPDVITLDIEMPEMGGLDTLRRVKSQYPQVRVIMVSTLTERGASATIECLSLGADDYMQKPASQAGDNSLASFHDQLARKIKQFFVLPTAGFTSSTPTAERICNSDGKASKPRVVAIGVSTGGPAALGELLPKLPSGFPLPVLIVQHMPPLFTRFLAQRLDPKCALEVSEAVDGQLVTQGQVLIAPGDFHMRAVSRDSAVCVQLDQSPTQNSCRPSVDVLFSSVAEAYGGAAIGVILTGMGQDGLRGAQILKARGSRILAQDEASSVVWGMPGAVVSAGLADRILPLELVVPEIVRMADRSLKV